MTGISLSTRASVGQTLLSVRYIPVLIVLLLNVSCIPEKATQPGVQDSSEIIPIDPKTGAARYCLSAKASLAWDRGADTNVISNIAKKMGDQATAPLVAMGGFAALVTTHMVDATGPVMNATQGKGPEDPMPVCGNWCGPNHPKDLASNPPATDQLDNACRTHDLCYVARGQYDCACDQQLVETILHGRNLFDLSSNEQKIVVAFRSTPCFGGCKRFEQGFQVCGGRHIPMLGVKRQ